MTATEENPTLYVEYSLNGTDWVSLLSKVESFNIKDSGIYKVAQCELKLWNKAGYYTSPSPPYLNNSYLRIRADVRGVIDTLFYGKTQIKKSESDGKKEHLTVTARGRLNPLLCDGKTHKYGDEVLNGTANWTLYNVLTDALNNPDSTHSVGITLDIPEALQSIAMKENFDRKTLLDAIQAICEYAGYTGWDDYAQTTPTLHLEAVGTTLTSPLIEIPAEPLERSYEENIDDAYNHILVFPANNIYFPARDYFCEGGFALGYWSALGHTTVSDESTIVGYGSKSIKAINTTNIQTEPVQFKLDLLQVFPSGLDCETLTILNLCCSYWWNSDGYLPTNTQKVTLTDTNNKTIYKTFKPTRQSWTQQTFTIAAFNTAMVWTPATITTGIDFSGDWYGDTDFNWVLKAITLTGSTANANGTFLLVYVDGLYFTSAVSTDPTIDTSLQVSDESYATAYGRKVLNVDEPELSDYFFIKTFAQSILAVTKNPIIKLTVKHGAKTWARSGQTVYVPSMPAYGLTAWYGRIVDLEFDYKAETKMLHSTFTLTPRYQPITSKEWYKGTLAGLLTYRNW